MKDKLAREAILEIQDVVLKISIMDNDIDSDLLGLIVKLRKRVDALESHFTAPDPQPACKQNQDYMLEKLELKRDASRWNAKEWCDLYGEDYGKTMWDLYEETE